MRGPGIVVGSGHDLWKGRGKPRKVRISVWCWILRRCLS